MNVPETKKRQRHFDRVTLTGETLARLDSWIVQAEAARPGVLISKKDILNWLILSMAENLSSTQQKSLAEEFYSELRYLQFAERAIKAATAKGERLTLKDLAERTLTLKEPQSKRSKEPRKETVKQVVTESETALATVKVDSEPSFVESNIE